MPKSNRTDSNAQYYDDKFKVTRLKTYIKYSIMNIFVKLKYQINKIFLKASDIESYTYFKNTINECPLHEISKKCN